MKKKIVTAIAFLIIIGLSGTGSYYLGFESGLKQTKNIVIEGLKGTETPGGKNIDFSVFWQVWDKLKKEHVNGDRLKDQDLVYGAIQGLTKSTDDPHTLFFSPEDSQKFTQDISGSFGGIGAEIGI
ncbi:MAG: hypothetical protein HYR95_02205, partial [Candidatus Colwellbacteria bacterium]|nr:hypothetical protein [Candidatus Colwellbacteria bacterium]